jgi:hypothetical protein
LDRQREHVANAALGLNHARCIGISLQLAPQPQDLDIDAAIENILANSGGLQQVFPRQRPLRRFEKGQQQRIPAFAQRDRRRIGIEQSSATPFELPALESISASFRITRSCNPFHFLPPQYGTEAGEQFPEAEWFYNIVVRPELRGDLKDEALEEMSLLAVGSTGADVDRIIKDARRRSRQEERALSITDVRHAIRGHKDELSAEELERASIHEAGHIVMAVVRGGPDDIPSSRGRAGRRVSWCQEVC